MRTRSDGQKLHVLLSLQGLDVQERGRVAPGHSRSAAVQQPAGAAVQRQLSPVPVTGAAAVAGPSSRRAARAQAAPAAPAIVQRRSTAPGRERTPCTRPGAPSHRRARLRQRGRVSKFYDALVARHLGHALVGAGEETGGRALQAGSQQGAAPHTREHS